MIFMFALLHFIRQVCFTWQTVGYRKSVHFGLFFWPFLTFLWRHRSKNKVNIIISCRVRRDLSNTVWIFTLRLLLLKIRRGGPLGHPLIRTRNSPDLIRARVKALDPRKVKPYSTIFEWGKGIRSSRWRHGKGSRWVVNGGCAVPTLPLFIGESRKSVSDAAAGNTQDYEHTVQKFLPRLKSRRILIACASLHVLKQTRLYKSCSEFLIGISGNVQISADFRHCGRGICP